MTDPGHPLLIHCRARDLNGSGRNLLDGLSPLTQTLESGKALASFLRMTEELPETIALANGARLTLSSKGDCYYYTSEKGCSCTTGQYGKICKHRTALAGSNSEAQIYQARQKERRAQAKASKGIETSIREPGFRPALEEAV
jgi:hypothetical protein